MTPDRDDLLAYALGTLPPDEQARVEAALDADPALRAELRADQGALGLLLDDLDLDGVTVPADAGERLLARVRAEGQGQGDSPPREPVSAPRRAPSRTRPAWTLPVVLGLAAALALAFFLPRVGEDPAERYARVPGAVGQDIRRDGASLGRLVRLPDGRVYVRLSRSAGPGRTYQLWRIQGETPVSLGVFQEDLLVTLPERATLAVSVEPPGGSPRPTTQPLFVQDL